MVFRTISFYGSTDGGIMMLIRCFMTLCTLSVLCGQPSPMARCLLGHMTDVQSWVNHRGRLTDAAMQRNAIDVSYQLNAIGELRREVQSFRCSWNSSVHYLSLARCQLSHVPRLHRFRDFCGQVLTNTVVYLSLFGNDFYPNATPWSVALRGTHFPSLKELDLRDCEIQHLEEGIFGGMTNLEKLYLSGNDILSVGARSFHGLGNLVHLDISENCVKAEKGLQGLSFYDSYVFSELKNLISLDLSYTNVLLRNLTGFIGLSKSLQKLSICHSGLANISQETFEGTSLRFLDVSGNTNVFGNIKRLQRSASNLQAVYADGIALKNLELFENLTSLEVLRVSNNEIIEMKASTAKSLPSLQVLIMDVNRLTTWYKPTASLMPQLKLLSIRNNNINLISEEMANDFVNLSYVGLSGNFIVCNCNYRDLFEVAIRNEKLREDEFIYPLKDHEHSQLADSVYIAAYDDVNDVIRNRRPVTRDCLNRRCPKDVVLEMSGDYLLFDYEQNLYRCLMISDGMSALVTAVPPCQTRKESDAGDAIMVTWNRLYLLIAPSLLLPIMVFVYVYRRDFRYFFITMRNSATLSLIGKDEVFYENTIFNYDVFVSYCNEDRGWVLEQLLPQVERDASISICLHERDFMVGLSILENIVSCMDRSKTIMLILSQKFLLSQWCQFEMHLAQHRLLETRREDLILVLLEDIPRRLRPNTLHYLMLTNTYIVWPKSESERVLFWRRLKKSLVIHKMRQPENVSLA